MTDYSLREDSLLRSVFDAIPSWVVVLDDDIRIEQFNKAFGDTFGSDPSLVIQQRTGNVLNCLNTYQNPNGCGHSPECERCVIRDSVAKALNGDEVVRKRTTMLFKNGETDSRQTYAQLTASPFNYEDRKLVLVVLEDLSEIAELQQLIPICCVCKKIRTDSSSWSLLESYFDTHWGLSFSHSYCPECYEEAMKDSSRVQK